MRNLSVLLGGRSLLPKYAMFLLCALQRYDYIWQSLVPQGYIIAMPLSYVLNDSHSLVAADMCGMPIPYPLSPICISTPVTLHLEWTLTLSITRRQGLHIGLFLL